jgi:hypothetical protein
MGRAPKLPRKRLAVLEECVAAHLRLDPEAGERERLASI